MNTSGSFDVAVADQQHDGEGIAAFGSEQDLVQAMCRGEPDALEHFFLQFTPRLNEFLLPRVNGDVRLAERLCQEVLIRAMQRIATWRGEALLETWLLQLAIHELSDNLRKAARCAQLVEFDPR